MEKWFTEKLRMKMNLSKSNAPLVPKPYNWDKCMMEDAFNIARMSKDPSSKIGAVVVSPDKTQISKGYNGFPKRIPDSAAWWFNRGENPNTFTKYMLVNHAEENAISQAKKSLVGWTIYVTHFPCIRCARRIVTEGIVKVFYYYDPKIVTMKTKSGEDLMQSEFVKEMFTLANVELIQLTDINQHVILAYKEICEGV
mgnify:CR=1 FL=1